MIRYRLRCAEGHEFDAWFRSSETYDRQAAARQVSCAHCGSTEVEKAIMAPRVGRRTPSPSSPPPPEACAAAELPVSTAPHRVATAEAELLAAFRRFRAEVEARAEYVGPRFAEEARRIDAGEAEDRGIYGEATREEARELVADGIAILPLPTLPEEQH